MAKKIFVSDFDATITQRDFFLLFMDRFLGEEGQRYLAAYRQRNNPSYQFLNDVFAMYRITEEEYRQLVAEIATYPLISTTTERGNLSTFL